MLKRECGPPDANEGAGKVGETLKANLSICQLIFWIFIYDPLLKHKTFPGHSIKIKVSYFMISCMQRLEFLGDSVLDHLITVHLYSKYPGMSPGQLTDLRSASVNNDRYAQSAVRAGLHRHILHASQVLYRQLHETVSEFAQSLSETAFGWECEINFPKVGSKMLISVFFVHFVQSTVVFDFYIPNLSACA